MRNIQTINKTDGGRKRKDGAGRSVVTRLAKHGNNSDKILNVEGLTYPRRTYTLISRFKAVSRRFI